MNSLWPDHVSHSDTGLPQGPHQHDAHGGASAEQVHTDGVPQAYHEWRLCFTRWPATCMLYTRVDSGPECTQWDEQRREGTIVFTSTTNDDGADGYCSCSAPRSRCPRAACQRLMVMLSSSSTAAG